MKELIAIQNELKAPKNLFNSFGNYKYRNLEGILEAVKPLLKKYNCTLVISDKVENVGDYNYITATAELSNADGERIVVSASARESVTKKGMDDSQITGTASSYARKYCVNGLFLIDDTKDADTDEYRNENDKRAYKNEKISTEDAQTIKQMLEITNSDVAKFLAYFKVKSVEDMTTDMLEPANKMLSRKAKK